MVRQRSPINLLLLTVFIDMVGVGILVPVLPLYAEHLRASPVTIGWLTGIYFGMQVIFTPLLGRLSDRYGRRPVLVLSLTGTALGFLIMGMARSLTLLFAARILAGITRREYFHPASVCGGSNHAGNARKMDRHHGSRV